MARLRWGMVGGGEGSQIGPVHRLAAALDSEFEMVAGALDATPEAAREFARKLGIPADRAYGTWQQMLQSERDREDRIDLVTVATPNTTHSGIAGSFVREGFHVLCEKPMTMRVEEAERIVSTVRSKERLFAVNFGYSGYPMVRQMKSMVREGDLGRVRVVVAEFAHGHHADAADLDNPRVRWRYDPASAGASGVLADAGAHALHMATFVTGRQIVRVSADLASCIEERELEDDALVAFRMEEGVVGRLWASAVAVGRQHGLTFQIFGEKGGLRWEQERPEQLLWTPVGGRTEIMERSGNGLSAEAIGASRVSVGHPEGMLLAFANIYRDLAALIREYDRRGSIPNSSTLPGAEDGLRSVATIAAAVRSAEQGGRWQDACPRGYA